eukprot:CAMPEP_0115891034 /NCGR_PEP_ID=MMETSP0287-20121206/33656_1 /TAXON_ID=412157 /ORGANISM="Chrysochromulina rotalis, Strain UIO044" /LENGTH=534 /DNA_ID=CAMNT_0003347819 /DNA_START=1 /DNA_END=1605 /DNA_ORIENTATION=-
MPYGLMAASLPLAALQPLPDPAPMNIAGIEKALQDIKRLEANLENALPGLAAGKGGRMSIGLTGGSGDDEDEVREREERLLAALEERDAERDLIAAHRRANDLGLHHHHHHSYASASHHLLDDDEASPPPPVTSPAAGAKNVLDLAAEARDAGERAINAAAVLARKMAVLDTARPSTLEESRASGHEGQQVSSRSAAQASAPLPYGTSPGAASAMGLKSTLAASPPAASPPAASPEATSTTATPTAAQQRDPGSSATAPLTNHAGSSSTAASSATQASKRPFKFEWHHAPAASSVSSDTTPQTPIPVPHAPSPSPSPLRAQPSPVAVLPSAHPPAPSSKVSLARVALWGYIAILGAALLLGLGCVVARMPEYCGIVARPKRKRREDGAGSGQAGTATLHDLMAGSSSTLGNHGALPAHTPSPELHLVEEAGSGMAHERARMASGSNGAAIRRSAGTEGGSSCATDYDGASPTGGDGLMAMPAAASERPAVDGEHVRGLLRSGKPALSVSESTLVANFLARQRDLLILCAGDEKT